MGTALAMTSEQSIEDATRSRARFHSAKRCPRCSGLMVAEWYQDLSDYTAQRCVQCGEIVDPVILQNRRQCGMTIGPGRR
jgi:Zn ribbon nucleic-acid-binding protein